MNKSEFKKIKIKLTVQYSLITFLIVFTLESLFYIVYSRNLYQNFDIKLKDRATSILTTLEIEKSVTNLESFYSLEIYENPFYENEEVIQIFDKNGKNILSIGDLKFKDFPIIPNSFNTIKVNDIKDNKEVEIPMRVYTETIYSQGEIIGFIRVGRTYESLEENLSNFILSLLFTLPIIIILTGYLSYKIAGVSLKPVEESYKKLKQFTLDASHELKTPLAIIKTNIEVALNKKDLSRDYILNKMEIINGAVDRMSKIIKDMFLLSKIDSGVIEIKKENINLNEFIEFIKEQFLEFANKKKINLQTNVPKEINIFTDRDILERIIINLVENAINYTPPDGNVTISVKDLTKQVLFIVEDTGIGIKKEELPHIFDRFFRSSVARDRQTGGAGLGLAIVKELVELLHGKIDVESEIEKGSRFNIYIPKEWIDLV